MTENILHNKESAFDNAPLSSLVVTNNTLGFRESAELVKTAFDTGCKIRLASGDKNGSTDSVLSLVSMGLGNGKTVFLSVEGNDEMSAISACVNILGKRIGA